MVTIINNTAPHVAQLKVVKKINLKTSYHKKKKKIVAMCNDG